MLLMQPSVEASVAADEGIHLESCLPTCPSVTTISTSMMWEAALRVWNRTPRWAGSNPMVSNWPDAHYNISERGRAD